MRQSSNAISFFSPPLYLFFGLVRGRDEHGRILFSINSVLVQRRAAGGIDKCGERGPRARKLAVEPPMLSARGSLDMLLLQGDTERGEEALQQRWSLLLLLLRFWKVHGDYRRERERESVRRSLSRARVGRGALGNRARSIAPRTVSSFFLCESRDEFHSSFFSFLSPSLPLSLSLSLSLSLPTRAFPPRPTPCPLSPRSHEALLEGPLRRGKARRCSAYRCRRFRRCCRDDNCEQRRRRRQSANDDGADGNGDDDERPFSARTAPGPTTAAALAFALASQPTPSFRARERCERPRCSKEEKDPEAGTDDGFFFSFVFFFFSSRGSYQG